MEIFKARTRAEWEAFAREHDCCLEPVLELDEALDSELVRAREMVVELEQPGVRAAGAPAGHPGQAESHPGRARAAAGPGARRAHRGAAARGRIHRGAGRRDAERGCGGGRRAPQGASSALEPARAVSSVSRLMSARPPAGRELLKMSELAERSGVSAGTIRYYLREGLLGAGEDVVRTSPQHGLLPARLRRADRADQAPAGGALHAAARDPRRAAGGPRARARADRARGPDPRAGADQRARTALASRASWRRSATACRATCSSGWRRSAC